MTRIGILLGAAFLTLAATVPARAQSRGRLGIAGSVDYTRITDDESLLGSGVGAAGAVEWRLTDATSLDIEAGRTRHVRDLNLFAVVRDAQGRFEAIPYTQRWQGAGTFVIGSISHAFGSGRACPVLGGGGGWMSHDGTRRGPLTVPLVPPGFSLQPGDLDTRRGPGSHAMVADGGGGVDVRVAPRVTLRPFAGLRLANTGNFGPKYIVRTGVRVGFGG